MPLSSKHHSEVLLVAPAADQLLNKAITKRGAVICAVVSLVAVRILLELTIRVGFT